MKIAAHGPDLPSLQELVDSVPTLIHTARPDGHLDFFNKRWLEFFGLRLEDLEGWKWTAVIHPDDVTALVARWRACLESGRPFEIEARVRRADGVYRWMLHQKQPLRDAEGQIVRWYGSSVDIDDRKRAEYKIDEQQSEIRQILDLTPQRLEAQLRATLNVIPAYTWYAAPSGALTFVNDRCADYLGLPQDHPLRFGIDTGAAWDSHIPFLHPDDHEQSRRNWSTRLSTGSAGEDSFRARNAEGGYRWFLSRAEPLRAKDGTLLYWIGVNLEIEERKRAEEALRSSESYLAEAQRLSQTGSWAWSPEQDNRYWSEECYRVLSFDPQDGLPRFEDGFQRLHPDDQPGFRELTQTAIREKAEWEADYRIAHPDGRVRDIHVVGHPVLSPSGDLVEFVGTVIDVTERKTAEAKIREQEMELRQILDLAPQQVTVLGPGGECLYANRVALDYIGLSLEEWRQIPGPGWFIHPDDKERSARVYSRSSGSAYELELRLRDANGNYRSFLVRFNPLHDDKGQVKRWYIASTDIEDRKRAEQTLQQENIALREEIDKASMFEEIVGTSRPLKGVLSRIAKVAPTDSTVLITGETGTGKELIARAIHRRSARGDRPFVSVNCAAIPRELIASELFGHEKGAFTGATQRRLGRFELAQGGTIFLDEVGELSMETQIALLRVLQEREFERVGGSTSIRVDVRVIAATNRDLQAAIEGGTFRSDLFYRLNVFPIAVPPLRERADDISLLVEYFIDRYARKGGKTIRRVNRRTLDHLRSYPWPGNVRELQNVIERSLIVCETDEFTVDESWLSARPAVEGRLALSGTLAAHEKAIIEEALRVSGGRVFGPSGAAARLGMPRSTLESKIRALRINKSGFRTRPAKRQ
jgi:PAS domain S-box-containing protein